MEETPHLGLGGFLRCTLTAALLAGCAKQDEEMQREMVELRATVQAKNRELEDLRAKANTPPVTSPTHPPAVSEADMSKAKARISELEGEVAKLNEQLKHPPEPEIPQAISMKFDADALKDKLEDNLTRKASELRELVLRQSGITGITEISIKRVVLPPEVISPFHSAITFTLMDNGKPLRVQFPVTADFSGSWRLPSPDKIQQACQQAREQMAAGPPPEPLPPSPPSVAPVASAPAPAPAESSAPRPVPPQALPTSHTPSMKRVDANTFVMDWGDKSASSAPAPSSPASHAPSGQGTAPAHVPAPVMPVQRDIIIKF
jgi:hypothetical protein